MEKIQIELEAQSPDCVCVKSPGIPHLLTEKLVFLDLRQIIFDPEGLKTVLT